jgi:hypothetical protein
VPEIIRAPLAIAVVVGLAAATAVGGNRVIDVAVLPESLSGTGVYCEGESAMTGACERRR